MTTTIYKEYLMSNFSCVISEGISSAFLYLATTLDNQKDDANSDPGVIILIVR